MVATSEFISKFHSLEGLTVGERRKNLFLLLNNVKQSLTKIDVSLLQPTTPLEENFKIEALLYFKNIPELLKVLKAGNPILIEKILNASSWFIEKAFEKVNGKELATQIFPHLSYNTKLKLLYKMSLYLKDTLKADEYFEAIKESYGAYLASKLLLACSENLIMSSIKTYRIEITPRQLLMIIKKYPTLTEDIFEKLNQYNYKIPIGRKYKYVFVYLAQNDTSLLLKFKEKYNADVKLGSRATNTMISKEKEKILETPKLFYDFLNKKRIVKSLKDDFSKVYMKLFPKSLRKLEEELNSQLSVLEFLPTDVERLKLLSTTFKAKHGFELLEHESFMIPVLIKMMSPEDREIWMQNHSRPKEIKEEEWISFMKTEKSIPLLKEKITFTSKIKERTKLIGLLVKTCAINNDITSFVDVCKYMLEKHRNDTAMVQEEFFKAVSGSKKLLKLEGEQWKYLNEFIALWKLKQGHIWACNDIVLAHIKYCLDRNLPVKELLREFTKIECRYNIFKENSKYEKQCLLLFNEMFPTAYEEKDLQNRYVSYLGALFDWNKRHRKDKLSLFLNTDAIKSIKLVLENETYAYGEEEIAASCVFTDFEKSKEFNVLEAILKRDNYYSQVRLISWLIKKQPLYLRDNIELIVERILTDNYVCLTGKFIRYYTHLEIPKKIAEICLNELDSEDGGVAGAAVQLLSYSMDPKDFLNLPALQTSNLNIDTDTAEGRNIFKLQQALFRYLRTMIPPSLTVETVLKFCKGDYLNLIQRSLYSVALNVPEIELIYMFNILADRAVSVRKHGIFLGFKVLNKNEAYQILTNFKEKEKNASIHKSLFKAIYNFFMRNPDDYSWELAKESVKAINVNDKEAFNILTKCKRIPAPYFVRYVLFTWNVLEDFENPDDEVIEEGKCRILDEITANNISSLPKEFCEKLIKNHFLKSKYLWTTELKINIFVYQYVIYYNSGEEQEAAMKLIFDILKTYIKSTWYDPKTTGVGHKTIFNCVELFCWEILKKECLDNKTVLTMFINLWNDFLMPCEAYDEYLYLQFTAMYLECIKEELTIPQIGEKLALLCKSLDYEQLLFVDVFCDRFSYFKHELLSIDEEGDRDENKLIMIENIVKTNYSPTCLHVAISLLPRHILKAPNIKKRYRGIIKMLMKQPSCLVKIHLHNLLIHQNQP